MDQFARRYFEMESADEEQEQTAQPLETVATSTPSATRFLDNFDTLDETYMRSMFSGDRTAQTGTGAPPQQGSQGPAVSNDQMFHRLTDTFTELLSRLSNQARPVVPVTRPEPVITYHGRPEEDSLHFLNTMERYLRLSHLADDQERTALITNHFAGAAKKWSEHYRNAPLSYEVFRSRFLLKFNSPAEIAPAMIKLYGQVQQPKEPVDTFITVKTILFNHLATDMDEEVRVEILFELLIPELGSRLRAVRPTCVEELLSYAVKFEKDIQREQAGNSSTNNRTSAGTSNVPQTPCRYCQEYHFHRECPRNPYRNNLNAQAAGANQARGRAPVAGTNTNRQGNAQQVAEARPSTSQGTRPN